MVLDFLIACLNEFLHYLNVSFHQPSKNWSRCEKLFCLSSLVAFATGIGRDQEWQVSSMCVAVPSPCPMANVPSKSYHKCIFLSEGDFHENLHKSSWTIKSCKAK